MVYMKGTPRFPMCGFSAATVEVLNEIGVPFKAVDILAEADKREGRQGVHELADDSRSCSSAASSSAAATSSARCTPRASWRR